MIPISAERTYRTRSGEACKVIGIVGETILFVSQTHSPLIVEELPLNLFSACVVEEICRIASD